MRGLRGDPPSTRPLADPRPFLALAAIGLLAIGALVWSLFRDPGVPARVAEDYMDVAGGIVRPAHHTSDAGALTAALAAEAPATLPEVPDLTPAGYRLEGGRVHAIDDRPGVLAIYHNNRRDLLVYEAWRGSTGELPPADHVREHAGRRYFVHQKSSSTLVFWQEGDVLRVVTAGLPTEHVVRVAFTLAPARAGATNR